MIRVNHNKPDSFRWTGGKDGSFSTRSMYISLNQVADDDPSQPVDTSRIWWKAIPLKVSVFYWKLLLDMIAIKDNFLRRGLLPNNNGLVFVSGGEGKITKKVGLRRKIESINSSSESWLEVMFGVLGDDERNVSAKFGMVAWQIWKERNSLIWNGTCKTPIKAVYASATLLFEWIQSQVMQSEKKEVSLAQPARCLAWHAPVSRDTSKLIRMRPSSSPNRKRGSGWCLGTRWESL
ncbi:hypothetical protein OROMI_002300 [Orobanche minor]